ncbi:MAG: hypothetical protein J6Y17_01135, partial [Elusimicrobiaceae bacterium]|nr:hypothetical protein [Elusimicrobiaceae bacterium]
PPPPHTGILNTDGERFISYEKKLNYTVMSGRTLCITHNAAALAEDSLAKRICRKETKKKSCANDTWQNVPYCSYGY